MDDLLLPRSLLLLFLLCCSAFFSACEAAFFSLTSFQLTELKEKKGRLGNLVCTLLEKPRELLITIYIGNELVNIAVSVIVTSIAIKIFGSIGVGIAIGMGTFLLLIFGDIVPKSLSIRFARTFSLFAAYPLGWFSKIVQPIQKFLTRNLEKFITALGFDRFPQKEPAMTDKEFRTMVQVGEGEGVIDAEERELIHNIIEFGETTVGDIMTPKIDMFSVTIEQNLDDILPKIAENFYSRVPVFDKDGENILGILFTKDLNRIKPLPKEKVSLKSILHPYLSVPASKKIKDLLQEFRKMKRHMAIVLDEYGSVTGLVTLEDILEELVGEIDSEMRQDEAPLVEISPNTYRLLATFSLSEFNEHFHSKLPEDEYDTVGGLVFGLFGRVPRSGEAVTSDIFKFRVEKMKGPRILNLYLTLLKPGIPLENGKESGKTAQV